MHASPDGHATASRRYRPSFEEIVADGQASDPVHLAQLERGSSCVWVASGGTDARAKKLVVQHRQEMNELTARVDPDLLETIGEVRATVDDYVASSPVDASLQARLNTERFYEVFMMYTRVLKELIHAEGATEAAAHNPLETDVRKSFAHLKEALGELRAFVCGVLSLPDEGHRHLPARAFADFVAAMQIHRSQQAALRAAAPASLLKILAAGLESAPQLVVLQETLLADFDLPALRAQGLSAHEWWEMLTAQMDRLDGLQTIVVNELRRDGAALADDRMHTSPRASLHGSPRVSAASSPKALVLSSYAAPAAAPSAAAEERAVDDAADSCTAAELEVAVDAMRRAILAAMGGLADRPPASAIAAPPSHAAASAAASAAAAAAAASAAGEVRALPGSHVKAALLSILDATEATVPSLARVETAAIGRREADARTRAFEFAPRSATTSEAPPPQRTAHLVQPSPYWHTRTGGPASSHGDEAVVAGSPADAARPPPTQWAVPLGDDADGAMGGGGRRSDAVAGSKRGDGSGLGVTSPNTLVTPPAPLTPATAEAMRGDDPLRDAAQGGGGAPGRSVGVEGSKESLHIRTPTHAGAALDVRMERCNSYAHRPPNPSRWTGCCRVLTTSPCCVLTRPRYTRVLARLAEGARRPCLTSPRYESHWLADAPGARAYHRPALLETL